jgi:membrane-associated protein
MNTITFIIDLVLHLDRYLNIIITNYGTWTYLILFVVIFIETGLVVTPFLPGDSLLFAAGALAAVVPSFHVWILLPLVFIAAVLGDTINYEIGRYIGPRVFTDDIRFLKREYLLRAQAFYEKHGGKTIFLARFIPIIRTFAPFVAGVGQMRYSYFISFNLFGGLFWTSLMTLGGYFFGRTKFISEHFSLVVVAIIIISFIPPFVEYFRNRRGSRAVVDAESE